MRTSTETTDLDHFSATRVWEAKAETRETTRRQARARAARSTHRTQRRTTRGHCRVHWRGTIDIYEFVNGHSSSQVSRTGVTEFHLTRRRLRNAVLVRRPPPPCHQVVPATTPSSQTMMTRHPSRPLHSCRRRRRRSLSSELNLSCVEHCRR